MSDPCDMLSGPCACGAWHGSGALLPREIFPETNPQAWAAWERWCTENRYNAHCFYLTPEKSAFFTGWAAACSP